MNIIKKTVEVVTKGINFVKALFKRALESKTTEKAIVAIAKFAKKMHEATSPLPKAAIWGGIRYILENAASFGTWGIVWKFATGVQLKLVRIPLVDKLFKMAITLAFSWLGQLKAEAGMKAFLDNVEFVYNQWADALGIPTKPVVVTTARAPRKSTPRKTTSR